MKVSHICHYVLSSIIGALGQLWQIILTFFRLSLYIYITLTMHFVQNNNILGQRRQR